MSAALNVVQTVFWGVIVLSLLVFVHEGGHYLASCAFHVRATEFFLGLPSRFKLSRKSRKVGTEFGVTPLLLGGYTRICGMESFDDEQLGDALAIVMREGRVTAEALAKELGIEQDRAYDLLATLSDWASIRPYYDPELGEKIKVTILATGFGIEDVDGMNNHIKKHTQEESERRAEEEEKAAERRARRERIYGGDGKTSKYKRRPHIYLFRQEDLDNDDVISSVESTPTYKRTRQELEEIKNQAIGNVKKAEVEDNSKVQGTIKFA